MLLLIHIILRITTLIATQITIDEDMFFVKFVLSTSLESFLIVMTIGSEDSRIILSITLLVDF